MRRFFITLCLVLSAAALSAAGTDVFSYLPASSELLFGADLSALLKSPLVQDNLDAANCVKDLNRVLASGPREMVVAYADNDRWLAAIRFDVPEKLDALMKEEHDLVAAGKRGNAQIFRSRDEKDVCVCTPDPGVLLIGSPKAMTGVCGKAGEFTGRIDALGVNRQATAWLASFIDLHEANIPTRCCAVTCEQSKDGSLSFKGFVQADNEQSSLQAQMMTQMYAQMLISILFNQDQRLGAELASKLKGRTAGSKALLELQVPKALGDRMAAYASAQARRAPLPSEDVPAELQQLAPAAGK